ncbi:MAG TPA: hypothetical protein VGK70_13650 [Thermoanaerobaculia bacterium]
MRKISLWIGFSLAFALMLAVSAPAWAQARLLDGSSFVGQIMEKGKEQGEQDEFLFKGGKFRATGCDANGFTEASYTIAQSDISTSFEAEAHSPKEGTMKWKGTVKGETIEGTAVWTKKGQADITYSFKGTLKK